MRFGAGFQKQSFSSEHGAVAGSYNNTYWLLGPGCVDNDVAFAVKYASYGINNCSQARSSGACTAAASGDDAATTAYKKDAASICPVTCGPTTTYWGCGSTLARKGNKCCSLGAAQDLLKRNLHAKTMNCLNVLRVTHFVLGEAGKVTLEKFRHGDTIFIMSLWEGGGLMLSNSKNAHVYSTKTQTLCVLQSPGRTPHGWPSRVLATRTQWPHYSRGRRPPIRAPPLTLVRMDRAHTPGQPGNTTVWKPGLRGLWDMSTRPHTSAGLALPREHPQEQAPCHADLAAVAPHNRGVQIVILPGSPGYALYPSAQVA